MSFEDDDWAIYTLQKLSDCPQSDGYWKNHKIKPYTHSIAVGLCGARYITKGQMLAYLADNSSVTGNEIFCFSIA